MELLLIALFFCWLFTILMLAAHGKVTEAIVILLVGFVIIVIVSRFAIPVQ